MAGWLFPTLRRSRSMTRMENRAAISGNGIGIRSASMTRSCLSARPEFGVTVFRARCRHPDRQHARAREANSRSQVAGASGAGRVDDRSKKTSARGMVIFRLPDSTAASGWSLRQLQHLDATPRLTLKKARDSDQLELTNEGMVISRPFRTGSVPRGYALQIESETPIFREAEEGDFWRVRGEIERDARSDTRDDSSRHAPDLLLQSIAGRAVVAERFHSARSGG